MRTYLKPVFNEWFIYDKNIYTKNDNDGEGRENPKEYIGKTRIKLSLVTLPSPRLWFVKSTVFH